MDEPLLATKRMTTRRTNLVQLGGGVHEERKSRQARGSLHVRLLLGVSNELSQLRARQRVDGLHRGVARKRERQLSRTNKMATSFFLFNTVPLHSFF